MTNQEIVETGNYQNYIDELERGYDNVLEHLYGEVEASSIDYKKLCDFFYFKVDEISYEEDNSAMEQILFALYGIGTTFSMVYKFDGEKLNIYIGADASRVVELYRIINGRFHLLCNDIEDEISGKVQCGEYYSSNAIFGNNLNAYGGIIRGTLQSRDSSIESKSIIDDLVAGAHGSEFTLVIVARPFDRKRVIEYAEEWSELQNRGQLLKSRQVSIRDDFQSISFSDISYKVVNYLKIIEGYYEHFSNAISQGLWETSVKYYAKTEEVANIIAGIIVSNVNSEDSNETVRNINIKSLKYDDALLGGLDKVYVDSGEPVLLPLFSNWYLPKELAVICELPHKDTMGIPVRKIARFDLSRKVQKGLSLGEILYKGKKTNNEYFVDLNELNRHMLVVGLTGGGKTNTLKNILMNVYNSETDIPFLIIEPAKKEYWELYKLGCDDIFIYSIGSQKNNLYINPFQRVNGVSLQTHIDYVFSAFKASFIMYPPMPYVLERSIYAIYEDCGWDISEDSNRFGEVYPTIENLYNKIPIIVKSMGYDEREQKNIIGALQARINSLRIGVKGETLNVKESYPIDKLLDENVVVELENIGDDEVKAFIISMILIQVMEYRIQAPDAQKELKHLILIEEAHRLLKNVSSGTGENADPRGNAVEFFCNMLAELRSKGQGFIIADQIPSKLAPDIVKNTNLKIVHRLVAKEERELVGNSMHMNEEQIDFLSTLEQGVSAIYSEGDYNPKLVKVPYAGVQEFEYRNTYTHKEVCENCRHMGLEMAFVNQSKIDYMCAACPLKCNGGMENVVYEIISREEMMKLIKTFSENKSARMFCDIMEFFYRELHQKKGTTDERDRYLFCFLKEFVCKQSLSNVEKNNLCRDMVEILKEL